MPMRRSLPGLIAAVAIACLIAEPGCRLEPTRVDLSKYPTLNPELRLPVLKADVFEFAQVYAGRVEAAANRIIAETDDAQVARNALQWKANAIPAMQLACYRRQPLLAATDAWAFSYQQLHFFTEGAGADAFGPLQEIAIETARVGLEEMTQLADTVMRTPEDFNRSQERISSWAAEHPLTGLNFSRSSIIVLYTQFIEGSGGTLDAVATMEELAIDLSRQSTIYAAQFPRQLRWQGQLLYDEILNSSHLRSIEESLASIESLVEAADAALQATEGIPALVDEHRTAIEGLVVQERKAILEAVSLELSTLIETISGERKLVLEAIDKERIAAFESIDAQRLHTMDRLTTEREAVVLAIDTQMQGLIETIRSERQATVDDVTMIVNAALTQTKDELDGVVDHFYWRLVQLVAVTVVLGPLIIYLYRLVLRPRG